jgi:hypothetical protein
MKARPTPGPWSIEFSRDDGDRECILILGPDIGGARVIIAQFSGTSGMCGAGLMQRANAAAVAVALRKNGIDVIDRLTEAPKPA